MLETDVSQTIARLAEFTTQLMEAASTGRLRRMAVAPGIMPQLSEAGFSQKVAGSYAVSIEKLEGLETRLAKALRGSGLCCQSRVATILSQHWLAWGKLGRHEQFIFWLEANFGIRIRMTHEERVALVRKADEDRWQAMIEEEAHQPQPGEHSSEPWDTTAHHQQRREVAQQAEAAGIPVEWTDDGPIWDESQFPVEGAEPEEEKVEADVSTIAAGVLAPESVDLPQPGTVTGLRGVSPVGRSQQRPG